MKTNRLIVVLLFLSYFSFSQEKDKDRGWYIGPNVSYSAINGFYYKSSGFDRVLRSNHIIYSAGVDAAYAWGRKYNFTFGIHYQETKGSHIDYGHSDSLSNPTQIESTYYRWSEKYLVLPVHMNLCLFKGPVSPYIITGFSPAIFLSTTSLQRTTYFNGMKKETSEHHSSIDNQYRNINILWQLGIGVDVNLNKNIFRAFLYNEGNYPALFTPLVPYFYYSIHTGISYYIKTSHH